MIIKNVNQWIQACELLLAYYKDKPLDRKNPWVNDEGLLRRCPLCDIRDLAVKERDEKTCDDCLWKIIEGMTCAAYLKDAIGYDEDGGWMDVVAARLNRLPVWVEARIKMLKYWLLILREVKDV